MHTDENTARQLAVVIVAHQPNAPFARTLDCVAAVADETIIVDTTATYQGRGIAEQYAARLLELPWTGDYSAVRNACLEAANVDWVFWLEAGETISETTAGGLREFVQNEATSDTLYKFIVRRASPPGYFAQQQIAQVRLTPTAARFCGRVRPWAEIDGQETHSRILHWNIDQDAPCDPSQAVSRARRNLQLAETETAEIGEYSRLLLARGEALATLGELDEARNCFLRARHHAAHESEEMLESYYGELTSYEHSAERTAQVELCIEALEVFPVDIQLLCAMGGYLQAQNKIELASRAFHTAVHYGKVNPSALHLSDIHDIAVVCLGGILQLQDHTTEAQTILEGALQNRPNSIRIRQHLIELYIRQDQRNTALKCVHDLPLGVPLREALANAVRGACLANAQEWTAAEAYLATAYDAGCHDPICLRWLAVAWLNLGKRQDAEKLFEHWRALDPSSMEVNRLSSYLVHLEAAAQPLSGRRLRVDQPSVPTHSAQPAKDAVRLPHDRNF